jgi:hypothetical protein
MDILEKNGNVIIVKQPEKLKTAATVGLEEAPK